MGAEDITRPETVQNVHDEDDGTGIYWFKDPSGQYEQVFVPHVTRKRARELADDFGNPGKQHLDAYRWVTERVESAQSLVSKPCGGICASNLDCVDNACRCIGGRCRRK